MGDLASCETLLPGVFLPPYYIIVISATCYLLLAFACATLSRLFPRSPHVQQRLPAICDPVGPTLLIGPASWLLTTLQLVVHTAHFVYILVDVCRANGTATAWVRYQQIYGRYLNSGATTVLAACIASTGIYGYGVVHGTFKQKPPAAESEGTQEVNVAAAARESNCGTPTPPLAPDPKLALMDFVRTTLAVGSAQWLLILLQMPALLTHTIPISLAYCWVTTPAVAIGAALIVVALRFGGPIIRLACWFVVVFFAHLSLSGSYNHGVQLYRGEAYLSLLKGEDGIRSTDCYFRSIRETVQQRVSIASFVW